MGSNGFKLPLGWNCKNWLIVQRREISLMVLFNQVSIKKMALVLFV